VAAELRPVLHAIGDQPGDPFIVSYQNGIEPGRQLIEMLGDRRVLRMVLTFGGRARDHGHIDVTLNQPPHSIGCLHPEHADVCRALAAFLTRANFATRFEEDIERPVWAKGIINAAMNPVAALLDMQVGQVLDSPSEGIVNALMREGLAVATARGIHLDQGFLHYGREVLERGRRHTPSMVQDIRAGRPSEVGQLNRQIVEHGRRLGVPTPTHDVILALIEGFDWKLYRRDTNIPLEDRPGDVPRRAAPFHGRLLSRTA
jgi:2-dehydropantoate 2-reductase